jgi:predicted  nucleic acid-binding Zn-ribbon protein
MILEWQATQIEKMQKQLEDNVHTGVMLKAHEKEIEKLKKDIEKLKDSTRDIKFSNGNGAH